MPAHTLDSAHSLESAQSQFLRRGQRSVTVSRSNVCLLTGPSHSRELIAATKNGFYPAGASIETSKVAIRLVNKTANTDAVIPTSSQMPIAKRVGPAQVPSPSDLLHLNERSAHPMVTANASANIMPLAVKVKIVRTKTMTPSSLRRKGESMNR